MFRHCASRIPTRAKKSKNKEFVEWINKITSQKGGLVKNQAIIWPGSKPITKVDKATLVNC